MSGRKKVKKKRIEPRVAKRKDCAIPLFNDEEFAKVHIELAQVKVQLGEAIECLKHYTKKDHIGDLANPAIELLAKWGISG